MRRNRRRSFVQKYGWAYPSSVWPLRREGKLEIVWSPVDETLIFTPTGGIFKDAPHPNAAKLYLTWFLAGEQQSRLGSFSSRVDVANNYREFMTNNKLVADLRKRFEGYASSPANKGGVR
jgi:ABC-type Fe3+ transport system substrate-binding protein